MSVKEIISYLDSTLKLHGFDRHKMTWNRKSDSFIDVIDVQIGKGGDTITINAGAFHSGVYHTCWATDPPSVIEEPMCIVRARIGQLIDGKDQWWKTDENKAGEDMAGKVRDYVLPFLDGLHSLESIENALTEVNVVEKKYPLPVIYLAIIKSQLGDKGGACTLLAQLASKTVSSWHDRVGNLAQQLGCH